MAVGHRKRTASYTLIIIIYEAQGSLVATKTLQKTEIQGEHLVCMDCRERASHARGVYLTQYTSSMETARVKEDVGADTRIIVTVV